MSGVKRYVVIAPSPMILALTHSTWWNWSWQFDCEIVDEDAENITTVQQAIDYIDRLVAN
jgi:hypothetical protein